jgi:hypothetical protein
MLSRRQLQGFVRFQAQPLTDIGIRFLSARANDLPESYNVARLQFHNWRPQADGRNL